MISGQFTATCLLFIFIASMSAGAETPVVTGNGYGYVVIAPHTGALTKFYAHPYRFEKQNPQNPDGDGVLTSNFIHQALWSESANLDSRPFITNYASESQVVAATNGSLTEYFFLPFDLKRNALITTLTTNAPRHTCLNVSWEHKLEWKKSVLASGLKIDLLKFQDVNEILAVVPVTDGGVTIDRSLLCGRGWAFLVLEDEKEASQAVADFRKWRDGAPLDQLVAREVKALDSWRVPVQSYLKSPAELRLWRQSESILRMAQIREPNRDDRHGEGLINASLPDGEWFIPWVRDMAFSIVGLTRMGHQKEARLALSAYFNAGPMGRMNKEVRGVPYQVSTVRYFGDGTEDADFSGAKYQNLEFDSWGLALWAMGEYVAKYRDISWLHSKAMHGSIYETARDYVMRPLLANMDSFGQGSIVAADSSIWEQNGQPRMHYAYSTIMAISGLKSFLTVAAAAGDLPTKNEIEKQIVLLQNGFFAAFVNGTELHGTVEDSPKNKMDGALLESIISELVTDPLMIQSTINRMEVLKTGSGGYLRVLGQTEYEKHEFLFIDFMLARVFLRLNQIDKAEAIMQTIFAKAATDNGFIPEMYVSQPNDTYSGAVGSPAGATPMVGYGAGIYMIYLSERSLQSVGL